MAPTKKISLKPSPNTPLQDTAPTIFNPTPVPQSKHTLFDPTNPVPPIYTNHESSESEQRTLHDYLANLNLTGLYSLWSTPPKSPSAILALIKATTAQIKERSKLYNIPYDSNDPSIPGRRLRTISLD